MQQFATVLGQTHCEAARSQPALAVTSERDHLNHGQPAVNRDAVNVSVAVVEIHQSTYKNEPTVAFFEAAHEKHDNAELGTQTLQPRR